MISLSFEVRASKKILKEIEGFDGSLKQRVLDLLIKLKEQPVPIEEFDVVKLGGSHNTYRVRIQKIRIIYDVYWKEKLVELLKAERKKDRTYK